MSKLEAKIRELDQRTMLLQEGKVISAEITDGMIEIDFELSSNGDQVIVEETIAAGRFFRLPNAGDLALIGFVDGDRNEGYVMGWIPRPGAVPVPDGIEPNNVYLYALEGEDLRLVVLGNGKLVADCASIHLGGDSATDPVPLTSLIDAIFLKIYNIFTAWVPAPTDGGLVLKNLWTAAFPNPPTTVASKKARVE